MFHYVEKNMRIIFITASVCVGIIILATLKYSLQENCATKSKKRVVCTTGMIGSVLHEIAGDRLDIICLMGPGVDPHVYKAKPTDVMNIQKADLILYNGLHLEGKMVELFEELAATKKVIAVSSWLDKTLLINATDQAYDPHVWHDVNLWRQILFPLTHELCLIDPENALFFSKNAEHYNDELTDLDIKMKNTFARIPAKKRILVTAHDAFSYFGRAYGFEVVAVQGVSTDVQPGLADLTNLVSFLIKHNVPVIFLESCIPKRSIEAVVEMVTRSGSSIQVGGELLADALGEHEKDADTYTGMILHNMYTIMEGFAQHTDR